MDNKPAYNLVINTPNAELKTLLEELPIPPVRQNWLEEIADIKYALMITALDRWLGRKSRVNEIVELRLETSKVVESKELLFYGDILLGHIESSFAGIRYEFTFYPKTDK